MISNPFVRRTLATLRRAEFGFLGVVVYTRVQTPRLNGLALSAGDFDLSVTPVRERRTSWLIVGIRMDRQRTLAPRDRPSSPDARAGPLAPRHRPRPRAPG